MRLWLIKSVLLIWPLISVVLMAQLRPAVAAATLLVGSVLILPTKFAFDFPLLPPMGREEVASVSLLAAALLLRSGRILRARPGLGVEALVFLMMLASIGTAFTNRDVLVYGPRLLPAMVPYDGFSDGVRDFFRYFVPFVAGRVLFRSSRDLRDLLTIIVCAGLAYSLLIMVEIRLSPQLNRWIYGFFPHSFHQHVRGGSYRPMVFMPNGLAVSQFMAMSAIAAAGLASARVRVLALDSRIVTTFLAGIVVACKGFASMTYAGVGIGLALLVGPRRRIAVAAVLAMMTAAYPVLRSYDLFPTEELIAGASMISASRAHSLNYRFTNEDLLLEKAQERVLFGWGGFNRSRVYDERRGGNLTITDGFWIIQLGQRGILGVLLTFGLMLLPVLVASRSLPRIRDRSDRSLVATLALIVALSAADLLPNGLFTFLPIALAGALLGATQGIVAASLRESRRPRSAEAHEPAHAGAGDSERMSGARAEPSGASLAAARRSQPRAR